MDMDGTGHKGEFVHHTRTMQQVEMAYQLKVYARRKYFPSVHASTDSFQPSDQHSCCGVYRWR